MDINGFELDQEYFGFGGYRQYAKSNTSFMSFSFEETDEFKAAQKNHDNKVKAIRDNFFPKADALPYDEKGNMERNLIFAQAESEILKEKARFEKEIKDLRVKLGIAKGTESLKGISGLLDTLGIGKGVQTQTGVVQTQTNQSSRPPANTSNKKVFWIVGGVAVLGIVGFAIYKFSK
jgi:hypothetical protein